MTTIVTGNDPTFKLVVTGNGPRGAAGAQGAQGAAGPTGPQGLQGAVGPTGATGATGPTGVQGPVGPQGQAGTGITPKGSVATTGDLPASGNAIGDSYLVVADGHQYVVTGLPASFTDFGLIQGPPGPQGSTGAQGPTGSTGPAGTQGATGATGAAGPAGPTGPQGPPGTAAPAQQPLVRSHAQLSDIDDPINTDLKTTGLPVWDSTLHILLIASGPDPDDPWLNTLGQIVISFGGSASTFDSMLVTFDSSLITMDAFA